MAIARFFPFLASPPPPAPVPHPATPVCVIGDIHGSIGLMERMLDLIAAQPGARDARVIFVGDLMDRGPDSAAVLGRVMSLTAAMPEQWISLMGNHERMLLNALEAPQTEMARWLLHGGAETLASLGLTARGEGARRVQPVALATALRVALPDGAEAWLRRRPLFWQEGGLAVVHAAADPTRAMADQSERALLWGYRSFGKKPRADGLWIAHGHTVVTQPQVQAGTIAVDTGAWITGRLTAAWLDSAGLRFLTVQDPQKTGPVGAH